MSIKHAATSRLWRALEGANSRVTCEGNRPVWTVNNVLVSHEGEAFYGFTQALQNDIHDLYVDGSLIDPSDSLALSELYTPESIVSFVARFNVNDNFFTDFQHLKNYYVNASQKFDSFFIFSTSTLVENDQNVFHDWGKFRKNHLTAENLLQNLNILAHHNSGNEAIFIDPSAKATSSIAIATNLALLYNLDNSILDNDFQINFIIRLIGDITEKNNNYLKEQSVFRNSIFELFDTHTEKSDPIKAGIFILKNIKSLETTYTQNFQAYISGLSLKQLKTDLASEQLKLSEQASKGLMDISGKMFALPAAVALTKLSTDIGTSIGNTIIFITCIILLLALFPQKRQLKNIKSSNSIAFKDLDTKIQEVNDTDTKNTLEKIRKNLEKTVKSVNRTLNSYIIIAVLPLIYISMPNSWIELAYSAVQPKIAAIVDYASNIDRQNKYVPPPPREPSTTQSSS